MTSRKRPRRGGDNTLRIIGGDWRGRKLSFPSVEGLRPSPDRVRETLFNWLAPVLPGSRCLDLFAGSGALGLEALSRGAAWVDLVDADAGVARQLSDNLTMLQCERAAVHCQRAEPWLQARADNTNAGYDVVFLDPPFHRALAGQCLAAIEAHGLLRDNALVYLETAVDEAVPPWPATWQLHREKRAGQVMSRLLRVDGTGG